MEKGKGFSRQEAVVTGVLATLVALALLAGLGWLIHAIATQPQSNPDNPSISLQNAPQSSKAASLETSVSEERLAARARAAEKVQLAEIPGVNSKPSANATHVISPTKVGSAAGQANPIHLPDVVKLEGLDDRKPPPSRVAPVDISGISRGSRAAGIRPANIAQGNAASGGVSPVAIAQSPGQDLLPKPVIIGPTRPDDADNLAPPELRGQMKLIKRLCADKAGNVWVGTEEALFRYSPNSPANERWTQMAAKELGDSGVSALAVDRLNRLWVGTDHSGVLVYNGTAWAKYEIISGVTSPDSRSGPIGQHVFHIGVNPSNGDVWISTEGGLSRYSEKGDSWSYFTRSEGLPCDNILGIAFTPNGDIFCASDCNGLIMAASADDYKTWRTIATGPAQEPATASGSGLPSNLLNDVLVGRDGTIWVASDAGLAYRPPGKDWQYLRGKDWAAKVKGRLDGPPAGWDEQASASAPATLLDEDYCTCLAEDAKGSVWLGHQNSYEVINPNDLSRKPVDVTKLNVSAILPVGNSALIAGFGDGLFDEVSIRVQATSEKIVDVPLLPSPGVTPTVRELNELLKQLEAAKPENEEPSVVALPDDWCTRGAWVGRYGTYWACLAAMSRPNCIWGGGRVPIAFSVHVDPRLAGENVRYWVSRLKCADLRSLEMPPVYLDSRIKLGLTTRELDRRDSYWDDHGETMKSTREGPDLYISLRIPKGVFKLSMYFSEGERDFRISIARHDSEVSINDFSVGSQAPQEIAVGRVVAGRAGVWKRWLVRGFGEFTIHVCRNHSHNTNVAAVMLDALEERPAIYLSDRGLAATDPSSNGELAPLFGQGLGFAAEIQRIDLSRFALYGRSGLTGLARYLQSRGGTGAPPPEAPILSLAQTIWYGLDQWPRFEDCEHRAGIRTARDVEKALRWDGRTENYDGLRRSLIHSEANAK